MDVMSLPGRKPEGLAPWVRKDECAHAFRTTLSKGPAWADVVFRTTIDLDSMKLLEDAVKVKDLGDMHGKLPEACRILTILWHERQVRNGEVYENLMVNFTGIRK